MIVLVQGQFEYRRIAEHRLMADECGRLRNRAVPELEPGEVLSVVPGQAMYRIIKHSEGDSSER
ncbi:hypothetical protein HW452_05170 [Halomonas aquamarina]|uniref:Uncharacterized protein n=1 Tax=Vreelandella aquamarina TaxID=77097 RepID=A0ACC5VTC7_9GAMM|nr:hypothetical protein [Halomonas aquamarina]MBZ5486912.1 hypothetical protein [Halomonas aquamarina]